MTKRAMRSIVLAFLLVILVVGVDNRIDLPGPLQQLVNLLDIGMFFSAGGEFADQTSLLERWVLPIDLAIYASVLFGVLTWIAHRRKANLPAEGRPADSAVSTANLPERTETLQLAAVLDTQELREQLTQLAVPGWWVGLQDVQVNVLKFHWTKRGTFEVIFRTGLLAKVYPTDRQDVHEFMERLRQAGFSREAEFSIPQPVTYLPSLRLLLQERVEGTQAKDLFLNGDEAKRAATAQRCALWLARFHALAPRSGKQADLKEELSRMRGWTDCLVRMGEPFTEKAGALMQGLEAAASTLGPIEPCAGHGSYSPEHVILTNGRTVTIDWDGYDTGDPSRDVARFIVAVQRLALGRLKSIHALDGVAEIFRTTYLQAGRPEVESRLGFFQASMCLQLAMYCVFHHRDKSGERKALAMLEEGLRALEEFQCQDRKRFSGGGRSALVKFPAAP